MSGGACIEGNTLVLGDSSYLEHHGILGQKWGIRRFQNKDGSRTAEGKKRYKTMQAAHGTRARGNSPFDRAKNQAIDKAKGEFNKLLDDTRYGKNKAKYDAAVDEWDKAQTHRYEEYEREFDKYASIAGMANAYRWGWDQPNTGFGSRDNMLKFAADFYKYDDGDQGKFNSYDYFLVGKGENPNDVQDRAFKASSAIWDLAKEDAKDLFGDLADKKDGPGSTVGTSFASSMFDYATTASPITMVDESSGLRYTDKEIKQMQEDIRKFSAEAKRLGTVSHSGAFVEDGTLYLEHHGIKGQRWGLRRFQNSDGSLTDAGRKRYGIVSGAKKAASMVGAGAKKTFDAGKKAATVIKDHREKAAEAKKAKLKEKASKSRLGVLANKDLFTADEMRKLNERFKIEDEMAMASLKKGADIVSNIATIAKGVKDVNSAVEEITGKTINPFTKAKNEADLRKAEAQADKAEAQADKERSEADKAARNNTKDAESKAKQEKESATKEKEAATEKKASDNADKELEAIKADTAKKASDISSKYDSPKSDGPKGLPEHTPAPKANQNEELSRTIKDIASKLDSGRVVLGRDKQAESSASNTPKLSGPTVKDRFNADSPAFKQLSAAISAANANKPSNVKAPKGKNIDVPDEYKPGAKKPKSNKELSKSLNELTKMAAKNLDIAKDKKSDPSSTTSKILEKNKKTLDNLKSDDGLANAIGGLLKPKEKRAANKAKIEALSKKVKNTKDPKLREKYIKDLANEATLLDIEDFEKFANGTLFKHSALSSDELAHYGVLGMKWGKHIMAGKGLLPKLESSGGGGGGAPEEEEDEENKIDPNYSRDKNKLPGKKHLNKATEYANKAAADRAKAQAEEAKMHKAQAEAASLDRKVKGASFWNDSDGYFVSKQRPADKKRVKQLRAEAKEHRQASKRYASSAGSNAAKSGKEYKKWIKTPSGLYDKTMRHDFIVEDGTLYLEHHGIKGQRWGVRRFQNPDGTLTDKGRKHYQKKLDREKRKQVSSDNLRGTLERQHGIAVGASGVLSAISGALTVAAVVSNPATIAAGAAIAAAVSAGITHGSYSIAEAWEGRGSRIRKKRIAKYENMLKQDAFFVEDGTLYLEHFGIKNMKWGIRRFQNKDGSLTEAGKKRYSKVGENVVGGGGGGAPEEDEEMKKKIEEAAKKAGMTVAEYRKKMGSKLYDMFGGKYKKEASEQKRKGRTDQYIAGPEQNKNTKHLLDTEYSKSLRRGAERKSRDAAIFGKAADEVKRKQASALGKGLKAKADYYSKQVDFIEKTSSEKIMGRRDWKGNLRDSEPYTSVRDSKRAYDKTAQGKLDKVRYAVQRTKQKAYNAAGGEYKRQADLGRVYLKREKAKENRAIKRGNSYDAEAARTWQDVYRKSTNEMERAYEKSIAGRYDKLKATITERGKAKGSSQIPTKNSSPDQIPTNRPVSREKTKRAVKGSIKVGERRHGSTTSQQGIKQGEKHEGLRTHTLPKMKSTTAKPMRKLTSKELSKIRSEARVKQLKKDGDYTGEYKKKRRK